MEKAERELDELKAYLGEAYDQRRLERWQEEVSEELDEIGDESELYRRSQAYLYNLTVFAMSGTKDPYHAMLRANVPAGARLLDYGCGIGSDGLRLIEAGYEVAFADFANPSVEYLRWRLDQRGLQARIYDLDRETPAGYDVAYAFDVIEHVEDGLAFLGAMEAAADLVLVNFLEDDADEDEPHHRSLPIGRLVRHGMRHGLVDYQLHHGRSHVVLYGGRGRSPLGAAGVVARNGSRRKLPRILLGR